MKLHLFLLAALLTAAVVAAPLVHYPFDGNAQPALGADLGEPEVVGDIEYVEGRHGQAIVLEGGALVRIPLPPAMREGEWTISFWLRPLWHPQDQLPHPILEIPAAPDTYDEIDWSASQFLISKGWSETISPDGWYGLSGNIATRHIRPGQWTHIAVSRSISGEFSANYINGEGIRLQQDAEKRTDMHGLTMTLGNRARGTHGHGNVVIDDLKIFGRAVSPAELPEIAGAEFPEPPDLDELAGGVDLEAAVRLPGTEWAPELAIGRPRVVAVVERTRAREIVELSHRFDFDLSVHVGPNVAKETMVSPERWEEMGRDVEAEIAKGDVDCVLVAAFPWNRLLDESRAAIIEYVKGGGGLLFVDPRVNNVKGAHHSVGHGLVLGWENTEEGKAIEALFERLPRLDTDYLTAAIPWGQLDCFASYVERSDPADLFRGGQVGDGRILLYDIFCGGHGRQECLTPTIRNEAQYNPLEYDYALAAAGRAVLWAAGAVQGPRITDVRYATINGFRSLNLDTRGYWAITVHNPGAEVVKVRLAASVRSDTPAAPWTDERGFNAQPGSTELRVPYTVERIGRVFADFRLHGREGLLDVAAAGIRADGSNPSLVDLHLARDAWAPGDRPTVHTGIRYQDWGDKPTPPAHIVWRLYDAYGRLIERGEEPIKLARSDRTAADFAWQLPPLPAYSRRFSLLVDLYYQNDRLRDREEVTFTCMEGLPQGFNWYCWGNGAAAAEYRALELLRDRYGLDSAMAYVAHMPPGDAVGEEVARLNRLNLRPWVYATHLGGRSVTPEGHRVPDMADIAARRVGQERLADIVRRTERYSPMFYSLGDEVKLGPWDAEPTGTEQDLFRRRMADRYGTIEAFNEALGSDYANWSEVRLPHQGEENPPPTQKLLRLWRHQLFADVVGGYVDAALAVDPEARAGIEGIFGLQHAWTAFDYRELVRNSTFVGQYALGLDLDIVRSFAAPDTLISCWYNYSYLDENYNKYGPWHTALRGLSCFGWFTSYPPGRYAALRPDFTPNPQFAWTWSELEDLDQGYGHLLLALDRDNPGVKVLYEFANLYRSSSHYYSFSVMSQILDDAGIMHDYIAADTVAAGGLADARVLVLAGQHVMYPEVANAIREWVDAGGILIADDRPARTNGLRDYETPLLDDLFADGQERVLSFGGIPRDYRRDRFAEGGATLRQRVLDFLAKQELPMPFSVQGDRFAPCTVVAYRNGDSRYVGIQRDYKTPDVETRDFTVRGLAAAHVYDCRAGKYLGQADAVTVPLPVAVGRLYAFLPYKATELRLRGVPETCPAGTALDLRLTLAVDGSTPDDGIVRLTVEGPEGDLIPALTRIVSTRGGVVDLPLELAYNDPPGPYTIHCRDLATGMAVSRPLLLQEAGNAD